jgi:CRP-like cAMP-binding protein
MTDSSVVDLLGDLDLLADLDVGELERIAESGVSQRLRRGDVVFGEGDVADALYVVQRGRVAMLNKSFDGRESVVYLMEPGDVFGDMPLFDGLTRSTEARALETSQVVRIPYDPIREVYETHPKMLWRVIELLSTRLRNTDAALADSVFLDVTGRTAKRLLEMAGDHESFELPVTQEELAGMVGASRERVNKAIASFVKLGWIDQADRSYTILDRQQLEIRSS